jgi:hypothetical protein
MDLYKAIRVLHMEKRRLEDAIASLEELLASKSGAASAELDALAKKRRGRTSMPPDERRVVSQRMKKYWAQRRAGAFKTAGKG